MIARERIAKARQLLAAGLTQRSVAKLCRISRGTVAAIACGRRRDSAQTRGPHETRCKTCGALVIGGCRACQDRAAIERAAPRPFEAAGDARLELDLRPAERARYEAIRARRAHPQGPPTAA